MIEEVNIFNNFITEDQCNYFIKLLDPALKPSPNKRVLCSLGFGDENHLNQLLPSIDKQLYDVVKNIEKKVSEFYQKDLVIKNCTYLTMLKGSKNSLHTDMKGSSNPVNFEYIGDDKNFEYSALLYLNSGYRGGQLNFPNYKYSIKAKQGDLIFFRGHDRLPHEVKKVKTGKRKNVVMFLGEK